MNKFYIIYTPPGANDRDTIVLDIVPKLNMTAEMWTFYDNLAGAICRILDEHSPRTGYNFITSHKGG